jgi:hypothetical protein
MTSDECAHSLERTIKTLTSPPDPSLKPFADIASALMRYTDGIDVRAMDPNAIAAQRDGLMHQAQKAVVSHES